MQEHQALRARAIALVLDRLLDLVRVTKKTLKLLVLLLSSWFSSQLVTVNSGPSSDAEIAFPALLPCSLSFGSTMACVLPFLSLLNRVLPGVPSDSVRQFYLAAPRTRSRENHPRTEQ